METTELELAKDALVIAKSEMDAARLAFQDYRDKYESAVDRFLAADREYLRRQSESFV